MRKRRSIAQDSHGEEIHINLTPLIDVVFVVLITFILIAPMLELDRVQLATGINKENRESNFVQEGCPVTLHVREDNTILFNNRLVAQKELLEILQAAHKNHPKVTPQVFHDKKANFGTYQMIKNTVELAGFEQMDVILQPG